MIDLPYGQFALYGPFLILIRFELCALQIGKAKSSHQKVEILSLDEKSLLESVNAHAIIISVIN